MGSTTAKSGDGGGAGDDACDGRPARDGWTPTETYRAHWEEVYETKREQLAAREWHADARAVVDEARVRAHIDRAATACGGSDGCARGGTVVDVGCGSSGIGVEVLRRWGASSDASGFSSLVLADVSAVLVEKLKEDHGGDERVKCVCVDCRDMSGVVRDGEAAVVIDKGTLDALNGEEDKRRLLREMVRMMAEDGVIVSVSFSAVARYSFLAKETREMGLEWRFHVVANGDPARGHAAVFVSVMFRRQSETMAQVPFVESALTTTLRRRMERSGSLYEDEIETDDVVVLDFHRDEEL